MKPEINQNGTDRQNQPKPHTLPMIEVSRKKTNNLLRLDPTL
jgi:hypothetical protein